MAETVGFEENMAKHSDLFISKIKSSGLDLKDAEELGFSEIGPAEVTKILGYPSACGALKIPYFGFDGKPIASHPGFPPFFRLRMLRTREEESANSGKSKKLLRYSQPPESGSCAYLPRGLDWEQLRDDFTQPLVITEGEFKAAKAAKEGFPTIGLGGVYSWKSAKQGMLMLAELEAINWVGRQVYITFDSDYKHNSNVCAALMELAEELYLRGALPRIVSLPDGEMSPAADKDAPPPKMGLDDYLLEYSAESLDMLLDEAEDLTVSRKLWEFNKLLAYVRDPGLVAVFSGNSTIRKIAPGPFKEHSEFATVAVPVRELRSDGRITMKRGNAATEWMKWQFRREVERMTYKPGYPRIIGRSPCEELNIWPGWGVTPKQGDISPFMELINHIFAGSTPETIDWFLNWCAYPIKYPGTKLFTAVVIYGIKHGTGKSLIGYTLGRIYGSNFTEISSSDLHGGFNEWAEGKQLIMGDDVTGSNKRQDADMLKKLITQRELRINLKYVSSYTVPDCINYLFTSNHPDAFFLEEDDRRYFIHEVKVAPMTEEFYVEYQLWLDSGGAQALFHFLLNKDLGDFNPAAPALKTQAKRHMIEDVRSDLGSWVAMLREDPDSVLRINGAVMGGDMFTAKELLAIYSHDSEGSGKPVTANGMTRELRRQGVPMALDGALVRTDEGYQRVYIVRDIDTWCASESKVDVEYHIKKRNVKKT